MFVLFCVSRNTKWLPQGIFYSLHSKCCRQRFLVLVTQAHAMSDKNYVRFLIAIVRLCSGSQNRILLHTESRNDLFYCPGTFEKKSHHKEFVEDV